MRIRLGALLVLCALIAAVGCSGGPKIVKVSGVALHKGKPVPNLRITFTPDKGRPSWGDTDSSGRFTLEYDERNIGALVGMHTVSAIYQAGSPDDEIQAAFEGPKSKIGAMARQVESKYRDTMEAPLRIEIKGATKDLELNFD